jgi:hypothetical protein
VHGRGRSTGVGAAVAVSGPVVVAAAAVVVAVVEEEEGEWAFSSGRYVLTITFRQVRRWRRRLSSRYHTRSEGRGFGVSGHPVRFSAAFLSFCPSSWNVVTSREYFSMDKLDFQTVTHPVTFCFDTSYILYKQSPKLAHFSCSGQIQV